MIFESWNQLKSFYGLNLKNVWMQKSFCLVIFPMGDLQIQMTWIQRAWIKHSQTFPTKLVSSNLMHWIDLGWFLKLGAEVCLNWNRKSFNLNCWATREILTGRPTKRSAPAGCVSGCPHSSVTRGWAKRYGATWVVRSSSNPTAEGHRWRETTPARTKPSAASEGCWGLTRVRAEGNMPERL